jgi:hypothetical protein
LILFGLRTVKVTFVEFPFTLLPKHVKIIGFYLVKSANLVLVSFQKFSIPLMYNSPQRLDKYCSYLNDNGVEMRGLGAD